MGLTRLKTVRIFTEYKYTSYQVDRIDRMKDLLPSFESEFVTNQASNSFLSRLDLIKKFLLIHKFYIKNYNQIRFMREVYHSIGSTGSR